MNTSKVSEIAQVVRTSVLRPAEDAAWGALKSRRRVHHCPRPPSGSWLEEAAVVVAEVVATRLSFKLAGGRAGVMCPVGTCGGKGGREGGREQVETRRAN